MEKIRNIEDLELKKLFEELGDDDGLKREKARGALMDKGEETIEYLMELIYHPKHIYRWEAVKTLEQIGNPEAIPVFLQALEDDKSDVRWIAAEGLIKLGTKSVKPLLQRIIEKPDSVLVRAGAHHVFFDLKENGIMPDKFPVDKFLSSLRSTEWGLGLKPLIHQLMNEMDN